MFRKVLIANRGEIAVRVIRACRELGIRTVAIYSEADRQALHVRLADEAFCVGPAPSARSYLNVPNIISAALISGADAIHPGYGYLAERADFAEICETHRLKFIGPPAEAIERMGEKAAARRTVAAAGVPVLPGSDGPVTSEREALAVVEEIGWPVLIKAAAGGGGKGMRVVHSREEFLRAFPLACGEAENAFGSSAVYLEKLVQRPRHVEIQVLADEYGHIIHLGERECSIQRRYQKLMEEAPSPAVGPELRRRMGEAAISAARAVGYANAGTVEFLLEPGGDFYFIEMNTRIQVEHPVTEVVTGIDLVKAQIRIAAGERLRHRQQEVEMAGHALECRINAEDPERGFLPCPGTLRFYRPPGGLGVRVDDYAYTGYAVPPYYDSLLCKVICQGSDRAEAVAKMRTALQEFLIEGIPTNLPFHLRVLDEEEFQEGRLSTDYVERVLSSP